MIKYHEITGMPVLSKKEGKNVGTVLQVVVDLTQSKIVALVLKEQNNDSVVLPVEYVDSFGQDCIMAFSENDMANLSVLAEMGDNIEFGEQVVGLPIVTEKGDHVGEIKSFCFDERNGMITHFITSEGLLSDVIHGKGLLAKDGIRSFGRDALVVTETSAELAGIMKTQPGLKNKATSIVGKAEATINQAKEKVEIVLKT
jgi:uncharacterized protein YrrD